MIGRGTEISSKIDNVPSLASAGSEHLRAYKSASAAAVSAARVTPRDPLTSAAIWAILPTAASIKSGSPSSPNNKSAPA